MESILEYLYFPIFPESSLAHSIITTVLIGIVVVAFFNLRYGWVLSGLVVPGYITPLLLVKPLAVWVIAIESIAVYLIVYLLSVYGAKLRIWSNFFGRDRFFVILLISVIVRVVFDGSLLPYIGQWYVEITGDSFDYKNNLHSFGLIIIALIANMFWKPGLIRGIPPVVVVVAITYFITRYILIEWTNFSLSNLSYLYEDFSSNILASPKSYIILLTTAFIASRMNLRYGWDFNGILIPALLALQWYQPSKIFISFIEAIIIYLLAIAILKLPLFKTINMEGARKILLFFNIGFFYKILLSYILMWFFPQVKVSDFFGFGYLLSTLIAVKMYDKDVIALFIRATLQTSAISIIVASIIGFMLSLSTNLFSNQRVEIFSYEKNINNIHIEEDFNKYILNQKIELYKNITPQSFKIPTSNEILIFSDLIKKLLKINNINELSKLKLGFEKLKLDIKILNNQYIVITDKTKRGWGIYVVNIKSDNNMLVSVPAPLDEIGSFESALVLFRSMNAKGFSIAGTKRGSNISNNSDVLKNKYTLFYSFFNNFYKNNCVVVRGYNLKSARDIFQKRFKTEEFDMQTIPNIAFIKNKIPNGMNLKLLKELSKNIDIYWENTPISHIINQSANKNYMEVFFSKQTRRYMITSLLKKDNKRIETFKRIDGYFQEWILNEKDTIAEKGSNKYIPANIQELLYFDKEVLTPLFKFVLDNKNDFDIKSKNSQDILNSISSSASVINYKLIQYHHIGSKQDYIILQEENNQNKKYRGSYIMRYSASSPYSIQISRPIFEKSTFEYGVSLFERSKALALQISGTHPFANDDRTSDLLKFSNKQSFYNLFNQVLLRETKNLPITAVTLRAVSNRAYAPIPKEDAIISFFENSGSMNELSYNSKELYRFIKKDGLNIKIANGSDDTSGYEVNSVAQALYIPQVENKQFAMLWLSPDIRDMYKQKQEDSFLIRSMEHIGIKTKHIYFEKWINNLKFKKIDEKIFIKIDEYSKTKDPILLIKILENNINIELIYDNTTKMTFLVFKEKNNILAMLKLNSILNNDTLKFDKQNRTKLLDWLYSKDNILKVVK